MARFQNEYQKLYVALKTSYESEKRLVKRCKDLNDNIVGNATRVKAAMTLTKEDSQTISQLKKEIEKTWKLVENAKEKEDRSRRIIQDLRGEVSHLHKIVEQGSGLSFTQDNHVQKLMQEKENLKTQLGTMSTQVVDLEAKLSEMTEQSKQFQFQLYQRDNELKHAKQEIESNQVLISQEKRARDDHASQAKAAKEESEEQKHKLEQKMAEIREKEEEMQQKINEIEQKNESLTKMQQNLTQVTNERAELNKVNYNLKKEKDRIYNENIEVKEALGLERISRQEMERQNKRIDRENEKIEDMYKRSEKAKLDAISEKDLAKNIMNSILRDFEWLKKKTDEEQANIMKLERDRNMLKTNLTKIETVNSENKSELQRKVQIISNLQEEVGS